MIRFANQTVANTLLQFLKITRPSVVNPQMRLNPNAARIAESSVLICLLSSKISVLIFVFETK